ncbi:MAG: hypothetical protein AAF664_10450 [Planctomycetota bacterium]
METLLRAIPDKLPELLLAVGVTEQPEINDDPDIGLSWGLPQTGIDISFDGGRVSTVFLYGPDGRTPHFDGDLPFGISWATSFDDATETLGSPSRLSHGNDDENGPFGPLPPWVRYDNPNHCIHIQFTPDKSRVAMVSVMTSERAP